MTTSIADTEELLTQVTQQVSERVEHSDNIKSELAQATTQLASMPPAITQAEEEIITATAKANEVELMYEALKTEIRQLEYQLEEQ